jgi:NAD(P)-dependent dehydrogenase (short-subunit alcohol dehydrogenase family)
MDRVVLVTGGGGRNMGSAICRKFAEAGDKVVVADVDGASAEVVAKELVGEGLSAVGMELDIKDLEECDTAIRRVIDEQRQLDVLCLHAGGGGVGVGRARDFESGMVQTNRQHGGGSLRMTSDEELAEAVKLDVFGNSALARAALQHMVPRGSGVIMVTISEAGLRALAPYPYTLVKHAMIGLVKHVAFVFGPAGIRCNGICPGFTGFGERAGGDPSMKPADFMPQIIEQGRELGVDPYALEASLKVGALAPRGGSPEEIANVYQFCASEAASFLNGAIIPVDAGWSAG